ncbi:MAG: ABC-type transport auxiliary lipoprotein family protein [Hyphomonas sp.]|uniref:ABC-type transport auxiliary lipoprotein family protein n=1 Tax=Hyphomonas sp. TaxID=87 RepID=UPI003528C617
MIRFLTISALLAATAACVSVLPEPETPDGLYRFGAMAQQASLDATVIVREPEASRLFGGRAIAAEDSTGALRLVRGVEWADSATRMMQVALLDSFDSDGKGVAIAAESGATADYELAWRVSDFTLSGTTARCGIEATLLAARTRDVVAQTNVSSRADASGSSNASRAQALAEAGRTCVREVSRFVAARAVAIPDQSGE